MNPFRTAKVHQLVQSGTDRAAGIKHIVNENDTSTLNVFGEFGTIDDRVGADGGKVVAIECDVDDSVKRLRAFVSFDLIAKAFG